MARGWRILDATALDGVVGTRRGRITLASGDGAERVVSAEEAALLIVGSSASITASALYCLAKHDVVLLTVDWRGIPTAGLYPWSAHGRVAARHLAQAALSRPRRKNAWMRIVRAKILGQAANLEDRDPLASGHLRALAHRVRSGDPTNVEGTAARFYWPRLFGEAGHFTRNADASDTFNGLLNYGYIVLRGYGIRAVLGAGLSPPLGLFHRGRANYFNLVDDLIEPFRPAIDATVARLDPDASLEDQEVKHALVTAATYAFASDGRGIPAVLDGLAQHVACYIEGDVDRLSVPVWSGPPSRPCRPDRTTREDGASSLLPW